MNKPPPAPPPKTMEQSERILWLAKHGCEEGYTLIHESEARTIQQNLHIARRDVTAFKEICEKTATALDHFFKGARNLWEGAQMAVFRAEKDGAAAKIGYDTLTALDNDLALAEQLAALKGDKDFIPLTQVRRKVDGALRAMRLLRDARMDRRSPEKVAAGIILDMKGNKVETHQTPAPAAEDPSTPPDRPPPRAI